MSSCGPTEDITITTYFVAAVSKELEELTALNVWKIIS